MTSEEIGQKIKAEREKKKISQEKLANAIGWKHHQIVSEVEQGRREIKAWELSTIARFLRVHVDTLLGHQEEQQWHVLWRDRPVEDAKLLESRFLQDCKNYLWLEQLVSNSQESPAAIFEELPRKKIDLRRFNLEDAYQLAETVRHSMALRDFPATQLLGVLQDRYGVKFVVSEENNEPPAACSRSSEGSFVFINGRNAEPRQYFSIAHELFHLITWDLELLEQVAANPDDHQKNEQLANAFAAGLLIPKEKIKMEADKICFNRPMGPADIIALAEQFQVSKDAMLYRMKNVGLVHSKDFNEIKDRLQQIPVCKTVAPFHPHILKSYFVRLVYLACEHVKISRAKAAQLLNVDLCDLSDRFDEYGFAEVNA